MPAGVNDEQSGPGSHGPTAPDQKIAVIDHGVFDPIPQYDLAQVIGVALVGELGRVDADNHQLVRKFLLQLLQLRDDMHAVDAAVGPEVQDDGLAFELRQLDRLLSIQPVRPFRELRRVR